MPFDRSSSPVRRKSRTRAALGQLVGDVLAAPLDAIETRLSRGGWLGVRHGTSSASSGRLREVLDRDRALIAAQPASAPAEPAMHEQLALRSEEPAAQESTSERVEQLAPAEGAAPTVAAAAPAQISDAPLSIAPVLRPEEGAEQVTEEPIRTRTMARLLAAQGYRVRALAIYQALLADSPNDTGLQSELARLQA